MTLFRDSIPHAAAADPVQWAVDCRLQVDGHTFDPALSPQYIKPIRAMSLTDKDCRIGSLIKPVQGGGSTGGEVVVAYWSTFAFGRIQENWQDDLKARERWETRILPSLESAGLDFVKKEVCFARFPHSLITVQGVFS